MDISDKLTNLKNQLLDLAIRGKLVEQRPEEGTAEELYTQIQEEKNKLIAEGKIKKEKPLPEITDYEMPFDIPESWKWVRLSQCIQVNPTVQCKDETDVSFIPMAAVEAGPKHPARLKSVPSDSLRRMQISVLSSIRYSMIWPRNTNLYYSLSNRHISSIMDKSTLLVQLGNNVLEVHL